MTSNKYTHEMKIPLDRVAVLIGKKGNIKSEIETATKTKVKVDSKEGDVFIEGDDGLNIMAAKDVILAIGRGFNPDTAKLLLKIDYIFEIIGLPDFCSSRNDMERLRGRVIGQEGKSRRTIEELTSCFISVFGKTVCIIGEAENVVIAKRAITSLLSGSPHSRIFKWLEKQRKELKRSKFMEKQEV